MPYFQGYRNRLNDLYPFVFSTGDSSGEHSSDKHFFLIDINGLANSSRFNVNIEESQVSGELVIEFKLFAVSRKSVLAGEKPEITTNPAIFQIDEYTRKHKDVDSLYSRLESKANFLPSFILNSMYRNNKRL